MQTAHLATSVRFECFKFLQLLRYLKKTHFIMMIYMKSKVKNMKGGPVMYCRYGLVVSTKTSRPKVLQSERTDSKLVKQESVENITTDY